MIEKAEDELLLSFAYKAIAILIGFGVVAITMITAAYLKYHKNPAIANPSMCVVSSTSATLIPAEHNSITVLIKGSREVCYVYHKPVASE